MKIFNGGEKEELNLTTIEFRLSTFNILIGHAKGKIFFENKLLGNNIRFTEARPEALFNGMF
uniref:Uncharacterized protein n=1 Tax=Meloidogyne enterolobii TaxID=390850 RepID=A0A6V7VHC2_MELEN|nr:unnamed protein product [Meloidogyne enterolobii]